MSKPTIHELEAILDNQDDDRITIRSDGEISTENLEFSKGAAAERAQIVAWLRKEQENFCPEYCLAGSGEIADRIERGEHAAPQREETE